MLKAEFAGRQAMRGKGMVRRVRDVIQGGSGLEKSEESQGSEALSYSKVCNLEDFSHPALRPVLRDVFSHEVGRFPDFPQGREYRKHWEVAMAVRAFSDFGLLNGQAQVLGVGAGNEPTIFYLTRHVRRLFATDLYLEPGVWGDYADTSMMTSPGIHWPSSWNPRRLVVQHMNGLDLRYEDKSFEAVFSSSSIEHFGSLEDVGRSLDEIERVLKPGGVFSVSTEYRIDGPSPGLPNCLMFDDGELRNLFATGRPWSLVEPLTVGFSTATLESERRMESAIEDVNKHLAAHGRLIYHELEFEEWPHLVLRDGDHLFSSVHLTLVKD